MTAPHRLDATVFVYRNLHSGAIDAAYLDGCAAYEGQPEWEHLDTLEPRLWIKAHYAQVQRTEPEQEPVAICRTWHHGRVQHAELWEWTDGLDDLPDGEHRLYTQPVDDTALLRQALEALEAGDWYINQLEMIVYSDDDTGTHEERAKVQAAMTALRERLEGKA